ncbi:MULTISPECIES: hypothetical protein [Enterobacteriaceae]|uniref:hypothetical protein n=1 Tax=Enterobacteriaceae TaxID=543 RepID=UPI00045269F8|nr:MULTISPECIES: hypothetical protein [Enterobacteriaceae]HCJ6270645.1 hypothetical protein [Enterobacter hormaechei subsp. xiangfangensis]EUM47540.1 hypothetical protein L379_03887 [Enterobacter sp. MGH 33]KJN33209.1 hypothetical protein SS14_14850 [Enterobacter bugandensis]MBJ3797633.1 hypothetical protein [Enterobacter asburiae]MBK1538906.1 hypothetical protein [Klebsiella pneumoniae]
MSTRQRNNLVRIEKAARASKRKYSRQLKEHATESIPGEWITEIIEYPATVPTGSEFELLQDVLSSTDNVYYKPRCRREYIIDSSHLKKWQIAGFEHYADYIGYCQTWGLSHHTQDFDILFDDKENNE